MTSQKKTWKQGSTLCERALTLLAELRASLHALAKASPIEERFPDNGSNLAAVITPCPWQWSKPRDEDIPLLRRARQLLDDRLGLGEGSFVATRANSCRTSPVSLAS